MSLPPVPTMVQPRVWAIVVVAFAVLLPVTGAAWVAEVVAVGGSIRMIYDTPIMGDSWGDPA